MFTTKQLALLGPRWIINFPTKQHWRNSSKLEWINQGLMDLRKVLADNQISSVAIPPPGCGLGGLDWKLVKPRIEDALADLADTRILIFAPL